MLILSIAWLAAAPSATIEFDPLDAEATAQVAAAIRPYVCDVVAKKPPAENGIIDLGGQAGFGLVLSDHDVAALSTIVNDAQAVTIKGPSGQSPAQITAYDQEQRIAIIRSEIPLNQIGLRPAPLTKERNKGMHLYALLGTHSPLVAARGMLLSEGQENVFDGLPVVSFKLKGGMPIFDTKARCIGISRGTGWGQDDHILITPESIADVRKRIGTETTFAKEPEDENKPWWLRTRKTATQTPPKRK